MDKDALLGLTKQAPMTREHHPEYRRGVTDAIIWLLRNAEDFKPEYVPQQMARDLL